MKGIPKKLEEISQWLFSAILVKMVNFIDNTQKINFSMKVPINNVLKRSQKSLQITPDLCTFTEEILAGKL